MRKKLLLSFLFFTSIFGANSQSFSNLVFDSTVAPTATTVSITFDFSGVSAGDVFEWQLFLAQGDGSPDWGSGRNIAYEGNIVPNAIGSGTQTVTANVYGDPVDGEVFTWTGKITLASDGSDTGYNNTGNLVTISTVAGLDDINSNGRVMYPNPVNDEIYVITSKLNAKSADIFDLTGRKVLSFKGQSEMKVLNVSSLTNGIYILVTDTKKQFRFVKK